MRTEEEIKRMMSLPQQTILNYLYSIDYSVSNSRIRTSIVCETVRCLLDEPKDTFLSVLPEISPCLKLDDFRKEVTACLDTIPNNSRITRDNVAPLLVKYKVRPRTPSAELVISCLKWMEDNEMVRHIELTGKTKELYQLNPDFYLELKAIKEGIQ